MNNDPRTNAYPDEFDRQLGALDGVPGVLRTRESTVRNVTPIIGAVQTWILQSVRDEEGRVTVFLELASRDGHTRLVLPPRVTQMLDRQRDRLAARSRSRAAKTAAETRQQAGIVPFGGKPHRRQKAQKA